MLICLYSSTIDTIKCYTILRNKRQENRIHLQFYQSTIISTGKCLLQQHGLDFRVWQDFSQREKQRNSDIQRKLVSHIHFTIRLSKIKLLDQKRLDIRMLSNASPSCIHIRQITLRQVVLIHREK